MATDIRRMTREELDTLNAEGKAWRERNKPVEDPHYHLPQVHPGDDSSNPVGPVSRRREPCQRAVSNDDSNPCNRR